MSRIGMLCGAILGMVVLGSATPELMGTAMAGAPAPGIEELAPKLLPAVVNIFNTHLPDAAEQQGASDAAAPEPKRSLGSGFIIDPGGIIVTNAHVIKDADMISVTLQDNTTLRAAVIGASPIADLA